VKSLKSNHLKKKRNLNDLFEKGRNFFKNISPTEKILLIHHTDTDGYCSGAIFLAAFKKLGKSEKVDLAAVANDGLEDLIKSEKINSYDKIIILDIDAPYLEDDFKNFKGQIFIVDHHTIRKDLNSDKIVYINPRFENEEIYQHASYISFKLLSSITDLKDKEWLAVLGTVGDFAFDDCRDLLDKWVGVETKDGLIKTKFWQVSKTLYGAIIVDTKNVVEMLLKYEGVSELESDNTLLAGYNKFEKELAMIKKDFWKNVEEIDNVIISKIDPSLKRVSSVITTNVSLEHKDKIIILLEKRGENFKISARLQSGKTHLGKLLEKCCSLSGGGHRNAAGGLIRASDFEDFKNCVISNWRNF
jgi:single-stranded DNA-specific DHH superfamily exonuclease